MFDAGLSAHITRTRSHTIGDLLHRSAARVPGKTAIVYRGLRQSYAELDQTVNRMANALAERGVTPGERVALLSHNHHAFVVAYFALARLGAVSVPVNFMLTADEVAYILDHCGASGLIAEDALVPVAEQAIAQAGAGLTVRGVITAEGSASPPGREPVAAWMAHRDTSPPDVMVADEDLAQLIYTSGRESRPKGAMLSARSLIAQYVSCLTVVDRKKDMIKSGGENVASREVEEVLYQHPAVAEAAVFGLPHPRWIEAVTAAVVLRDGAVSSADELIVYCRGKLAGFKVPKHIVIVGQLPKNASGKLLKRELRSHVQAPWA